jgi:hypothetical protein
MENLIHLLAPLARERAYLDPGSGSILLQLLVAAALGAAFAVKVYWKKIKAAFGKKGVESEQTLPENETPGDKPESN